MRNKRQSESIDPKSGRESWREEEPLSWVFKPAVGSGGYGVQRVDSTGKLTTMGKGIAQVGFEGKRLCCRARDGRSVSEKMSLGLLWALHIVRLTFQAICSTAESSISGCEFLFFVLIPHPGKSATMCWGKFGEVVRTIKCTSLARLKCVLL